MSDDSGDEVFASADEGSDFESDKKKMHEVNEKL